MAKRKIVWTEKANFERKEILNYWILRNESKVFSIKLNKLFIHTLGQIAEDPEIGRKTELKDVRVKIVRDYLFFYEYSETQIKVLAVWDGHRNEKTREIR